jgi:hypothetical protein
MIAWAMTFAKAQGLRGQAATEVAAKLAEAELSKARLSQQCRQWSSAAGELEGLLRDKQAEVHQLQHHTAQLQSTAEYHQHQLNHAAQQQPPPPPHTGDARTHPPDAATLAARSRRYGRRRWTRRAGPCERTQRRRQRSYTGEARRTPRGVGGC